MKLFKWLHALTLILITLKLTNNISFSWRVVLSSSLINISVGIILFAIIGAGAYVTEKRK